MPALLIVGFGDVAKRALPALLARYWPVYALVRSAEAARAAAARDAVAVVADLDRPDSLAALAGLADRILHLAPPGPTGTRDERTRALADALTARGMLPQRRHAIDLQRLVYVSTTGVYGDCGGAWIDETRPVNPQTDRARRRVDAERALIELGERTGASVSILRAPGIYAADRLPVERLARGTPALRPEDDVYTNHIHADDLARACVAALERGAPGRVYNVVDDSAMKMGEYFDLVAERAGLARPPRVARAEAARQLSPVALSFMTESRRIANRRMKEELAVVLRYPSVREGVPLAVALAAAPSPKRS
ncbi:MAG: SDR family oxidoreductase [Burkholderiales bacterium]|nr:SDR family oxidoreductase [Burkholderiales bacterium]